MLCELRPFAVMTAASSHNRASLYPHCCVGWIPPAWTYVLFISFSLWYWIFSMDLYLPWAWPLSSRAWLHDSRKRSIDVDKVKGSWRKKIYTLRLCYFLIVLLLIRDKHPWAWGPIPQLTQRWVHILEGGHFTLQQEYISWVRWPDCPVQKRN